MKILWIVNKLTGKLHLQETGKKSTGGLWLEAMIDSAQKDSDIEIVIVNIMNTPSMRLLEDGNIRYYSIPGEPNENYDYKSVQAHKFWREIIEKENPDIIELWGTEMPMGLAALPEAHNIPAIVYVQGVLESIGRYYLAGMTDKEIRSACTLRDVFTQRTLRQVQRNYLKRSRLEIEMICRAKNIIVENDWAAAYYKRVCPDVQVYRCPLSISQEFEKEHWSIDKMHPHTLMCSAANYPIKGLHMLLKALAIVKVKYPDVKLSIPGTKLRKPTNITTYLKQNGYDKYICNLIKDLQLTDNVEYTGRLTAAEMAQRMSTSNCFVMASAIENHSSTLKEAMTVGVPCVASYVGGVPQYALHESNCLLYRFEDYEMLAYNIMRLFESQDLCQHLSQNAVTNMKESREKNDFYKISKEIYAQLIKK